MLISPPRKCAGRHTKPTTVVLTPRGELERLARASDLAQRLRQLPVCPGVVSRGHPTDRVESVFEHSDPARFGGVESGSLIVNREQVAIALRRVSCSSAPRRTSDSYSASIIKSGCSASEAACQRSIASLANEAIRWSPLYALNSLADGASGRAAQSTCRALYLPMFSSSGNVIVTVPFSISGSVQLEPDAVTIVACQPPATGELVQNSKSLTCRGGTTRSGRLGIEAGPRGHKPRLASAPWRRPYGRSHGGFHLRPHGSLRWLQARLQAASSDRAPPRSGERTARDRCPRALFGRHRPRNRHRDERPSRGRVPSCHEPGDMRMTLLAQRRLPRRKRRHHHRTLRKDQASNRAPARPERRHQYYPGTDPASYVAVHHLPRS